MPGGTDIPALADLHRVPAIELFVQRAEAANRSFALTAENAGGIVEIARRLEGLPLAIELAAARVKVLTPAALLDRLSARLPLLTDGPRDLPPRHHAIRATIAWSYDLLQPRQRALFEQLSVFAGSCPLDGIETIAPEDEDDLLDTVTALLDQSLIHRIPDESSSPRFGMLETIREFGQERLAASGAGPATARAHASWVLALARRAEPELTGPDQERWFGTLAREIANIRAALTWSLDTQDAEIALNLCGTLYRFWATSGRYEEGGRWIAAALELPPTNTSPAQRGHALLGAGVMAYFRGDYAAVESDWHDALAAFESVCDRRGIGYAHGNLGLVADAVEDYNRAIASYERALVEFRALNDETFVGFMLNNLGLIHYFTGNLDRAADLYAESLAIARRRKSADSIAYVLGNAGLVEFARENFAVATELQKEALTIRRELTNPSALAKCLENFALLAAAQHQPERAIRLFAAASHERERIGTAVPPNDAEVNNRYISQARAQLGESRFEYHWVAGEDLEITEAIDLALDRDGVLSVEPG
jgi:tetratricopeptide (TPR) repeat protein